MPTEIFLIGAGGHGKVVLDAMLESGITREAISIVDGDPARSGKDFLGFEVRPESDPRPARYLFHVAIGDCATRQRVHEQHARSGGQPLSVIHPRSTVSRFSTIGDGSFVAALAVVGPSARVGFSSIINHGAVVDHDCVLGESSHVAPNATLGGAVTIGARTLVGAGATVLSGVKVGEDSIIGAGAVVLYDVEPRQIYIGIPAVKMRRS